MTDLSLATRIALTVCFMALLTLASLVPGHHKPGDFAFIWLVAKTPTLVQKILHICFYGVLTLLLVWTLDSIQSRTYRFLIALIIAVAFGAVMEWCQTRVPGRFGTLFDVVLNAAGAALGLLAAIFLLLKPLADSVGLRDWLARRKWMVKNLSAHRGVQPW